MRMLLVVGLVAIGVLLMANPLYLPIAVGGTAPAYTHTATPVDNTSTLGGANAVDVGENATLAYADLDAEAREAFDRARTTPEGGFGVEDPDERVESLSYPTDPRPGDGLLVVEYEGEHYEFWTRTVERESTLQIVQRAVVQPVGFLIGFFSVVLAVAVVGREALEATA